VLDVPEVPVMPVPEVPVMPVPDVSVEDMPVPLVLVMPVLVIPVSVVDIVPVVPVAAVSVDIVLDVLLISVELVPVVSVLMFVFSSFLQAKAKSTRATMARRASVFFIEILLLLIEWMASSCDVMSVRLPALTSSLNLPKQGRPAVGQGVRLTA